MTVRRKERFKATVIEQREREGEGERMRGWRGRRIGKRRLEKGGERIKTDTSSI